MFLIVLIVFFDRLITAKMLLDDMQKINNQKYNEIMQHNQTTGTAIHQTARLRFPAQALLVVLKKHPSAA